jgi:hypothetical protein
MFILYFNLMVVPNSYHSTPEDANRKDNLTGNNMKSMQDNFQLKSNSIENANAAPSHLQQDRAQKDEENEQLKDLDQEPDLNYDSPNDDNSDINYDSECSEEHIMHLQQEQKDQGNKQLGAPLSEELNCNTDLNYDSPDSDANNDVNYDTECSDDEQDTNHYTRNTVNRDTKRYVSNEVYASNNDIDYDSECSEKDGNQYTKSNEVYSSNNDNDINYDSECSQYNGNTKYNEVYADPNYNSSDNEDLTKDICLD